jgi:hypothetical protein
MTIKSKAFDSALAMQAVLSAATGYADYAVDRDSEDGEHVVPGELRRFLARLKLLHGVPFSYLVPDARLLPPESIRFFYLDRAWCDALVQGALSVGTVSSADRAQLEAVYPHIAAEVDDTERRVRKPGNEKPLQGGSGTVTGFLLRSRAVSGWPNLHVRAYARDLLKDDALTTTAESDPSRLKLLRLERLAPAVLLALIDGVPAVVHIEEPRQGLQFGVRMDPDAPPDARGARVKLRDNANGQLLDDDVDFTAANSVRVPFRRDAPGVIAMTELRRRLSAQVPNKTQPLLAPNEFALQMLRFPFRQVFGDPKDTESMRFYDIDRFRVRTELPAWRTQVETGLSKMQFAINQAAPASSPAGAPEAAPAPARRAGRKRSAP